MTPRYDIRISKDFINAHNDFEWFASDMQHIKDIVNASPGAYKESPSMGVGIRNYVNSVGYEKEIAREVTIQLEADGYSCRNPKVAYSPEGQLTVNPNIEL